MTETNQAEICEELIRAIADQDYVETVKLQKDATVPGKTGSHSVDLYWEFTDSDLTYKTLISFRTLNTVAGRADIVALAETLRDIYGQVTGVLFSRPVYDKDVKIMADKVGISLCEIMPPLPDTWEPFVGNLQIIPDAEFLQKEKARLNITEQIMVSSTNPKQLFLYNQNFECTDTVGGIIDAHIEKADPGNFGVQEIRHIFPAATFLQTGHATLAFIKILEISFTLEFELIRPLTDEEKELEMEKTVNYILHNISRFIDFQ